MIKEQPIRVAHIIGKWLTGGVTAVVMNYYKNIDRSKVQFEFIIDEDSDFVPCEEISELGGKIHIIPPYQKIIAYHKSLLKLFRERNYRIVHSHINTLSVLPLFAAKRANVPIRIAHNHSTAGKGEASRNILKYSLRPFSRVFPTHFCACCEYVGRWLFGNRQYDLGRVKLIRNAVDLSKFTFDQEVRKAVREKLEIEDKYAVIHIGRFVTVKNHHFLLEIFKEIHTCDPESVLLLVGEGELEKEVSVKVDHLGLSACVQFLGARNDVESILQGADVFLLPSLYEGLPVVAVEAQCSGLPSVISDNVTKEADLTDLCTRLSLNSSPKKWGEAVLAYRSFPRKAYSEFVSAGGYDIRCEARMLMDYYNNLIGALNHR